MKFRVFVSLRAGIHDPQSIATQQALSGLIVSDIQSLKMGRFFDVQVSDLLDVESARAQVIFAASQLLANPVMENYTVEGPFL